MQEPQCVRVPLLLSFSIVRELVCMFDNFEELRKNTIPFLLKIRTLSSPATTAICSVIMKAHLFQ